MPATPKPLIDVRPDHWAIVRDILQKHVPQYEVWAFGSRAKWSAKEYSDLDLAVITDKPLSISVSAALADDFAESDLPWKVDVVDWASTAKSFRKIIERDKVVVQKGARNTSGKVDEWKLASLREAGVSLIDCDHRTPAAADRGYPYIAIPQIKQGRLDLSNVRYISPEHFVEWTRKAKPRHHDVILSRRCNPGESAYVPAGLECALGQNLVLLRSDATKVFPPFLRWLVRGPNWWEQVNIFINVGAIFDSLKCADIPNFKIPLPPLHEQKSIAHILGTLDDKIELNRRMNETLEAIARATFKSWFVDFAPVRAKMSGEQPESICQRLGLTPELLALFPDRLVDSELGEIPEGWDVRSIGDVAQVIKGKSYKSSELSPSNTALVTLKSFTRGGGYRLDGLKEYTGSYKQEQEVRGGDLIVAYTDVTQAADVIGKSAMVISDDTYEHLVISLDVAVVRPKLDEHRFYLYGVMSEAVFQQHTRAHTTGTTVLHLAASAVPGFRFALPGHALVSAFANTAKPIFESINHRVAEGRTLESLRDTLLPKLMSGELRVLDEVPQ